ncbi:CU044_5270 family protein [Sphaerisporangium fuscum]|uniref:CU044_5270 family protein n=1 Tax=Sphaerisporangium fuscum TaxID=2835868 RepID=UPI001BDDC367|nr:CU044_5270 family protein [Sphaerisporangium fuscum]
MKRKNVLEVLAAARPADLDPPGMSSIREFPHQVRRRRRGWIGAVAASVATVSVIGLATVPRLVGGDVSTGRLLGGPAAHALDAAADRAAAQPARSGRYWHTRGYILDEEIIGPPGGRYRVKTRVEASRWAPRDPATALVLAESGLPTTPASAADTRAWRRAGSPKLCGDDTDCGNDTAPLGRTRYMFMQSNWPYREEGLPLPVNELLALPQDPVALKERLLSFWPAYHASMADWPSPFPGYSLRPRKDDWLRDLSLDLLQYGPISPGTRAALYRLVAGSPGTRFLGQVRDVTGRQGVAVGWTTNEADGQSERQLVVDESDGSLLAVQNVVVKPLSKDPQGQPGLAGLPAGTVYHALVYERSGWTESPPKLPARCDAKAGKECVV